MTDKNQKLIEDYIDSKLTGEDLVLFESRLKSDKVLAEEYKLRIGIQKLWKDTNEYEQTKANITTILSKRKISFYRSTSFYFMSAAASIIILVSIYFLLFHNDSTENYNINTYADLQDSISNEEKPIVFQYDEPVKLAATDSVSSDIKLLFPIKGEAFYISQSITFKWKSDSNLDDTLFVSNKSDKQILLKLRVKLADTTYTIKYPQFSEGKYLWYISDSTNYEMFSVINK